MICVKTYLKASLWLALGIYIYILHTKRSEIHAMLYKEQGSSKIINLRVPSDKGEDQKKKVVSIRDCFIRVIDCSIRVFQSFQ